MFSPRNVLCTVTVQGYGCTETGGLASCQDKESKETGSVGYPPINGSILLESWDEGGYSVDDNGMPPSPPHIIFKVSAISFCAL